MIHKVNRPLLTLVPRTKHLENDPGGSQGSGLFYDGPPQKDSQPQNNDGAEEDAESAPKTRLSIVSSVEKIGMTEVIKNLLENKMDAPPANAGLTTSRYAHDSANPKGLLLNKKAE